MAVCVKNTQSMCKKKKYGCLDVIRVSWEGASSTKNPFTDIREDHLAKLVYRQERFHGHRQATHSVIGYFSSQPNSDRFIAAVDERLDGTTRYHVHRETHPPATLMNKVAGNHSFEFRTRLFYGQYRYCLTSIVPGSDRYAWYSKLRDLLKRDDEAFRKATELELAGTRPSNSICRILMQMIINGTLSSSAIKLIENRLYVLDEPTLTLILLVATAPNMKIIEAIVAD